MTDKTYKLLKNIPESSEESSENASNPVIEAYRIGRFLQQAKEAFAELKAHQNLEQKLEDKRNEQINIDKEIQQQEKSISPVESEPKEKSKTQKRPELKDKLKPKVQKLKLKTKPVGSVKFKKINTFDSKQQLSIPPIELIWSDWYSWNDLKKHLRKSKIKLPTTVGVYEVKLKNKKEILVIGKATNLRSRIKQGLVVGSVSYNTGKKIRKNEKCSHIVIRWVETDRPATVEETLILKYKEDMGQYPKYTGGRV